MQAAPAMNLRQARVAVVVLGLGLVISTVAWRYTEGRVRTEAAGEFKQMISRATDMLDYHLRTIGGLLNGLQGLFNASSQVTRREFHTYLAGFDIEHAYPGIRAISFVERVPASAKAAFTEQVRRDTSMSPDGYPDFAIRPPGERDEYFVIKYIEPMRGNEAGFGLDLAINPSRRADIISARDSGTTMVSSPSAAAVDPNETSFTMRVPLYRRGMPTGTLEERQEAFRGSVAAVIHARALLQSLFREQLGSNFHLRIHDVGRASYGELNPLSRENFLYDSRVGFGAQPPPAAENGEEVTALDIAGRRWLLTFTPPAHAYGATQALPMVVLLGGIVTSLLFFWLVWVLSASRERALKLAEHATVARAAESLREQLTFIQQLIEAVPQPIFFKDAAERRYLGVNEAWERFFGIPRGEFIGKTVFELYPHDPALAGRHHAKDEELFSGPGSQSYEATIVSADGKVHHTIYNKAIFNDARGKVAGLIGTITDITELKEAESALRESEARFRDLTELSSDWYWEQDADLRFTQISSQFGHLSIDPAGTIGMRRWELLHTGVTEQQWQAHKELVARHESFEDFIYQRHDAHGDLRTISVSGRPIFDEQGNFKGYRGIGRDITAQKRAEEQIRHMAHHDALTGLPNRALLQDRIGQAIAQSKRSFKGVALLFIDLDRFKTVNDSLGHHVGDELLRKVSTRLADCVRTTDTVARIGGDEFVILLTDLNQAVDARYVAQKVLDVFSGPIVIGAHELYTTPSIGIGVYPNDGEDAAALLRNADAAMYHAKESGRNNYQFFAPAMSVVTHERLSIERDLRQALERGELKLHYQPQIDLRTGEIVGFEALARWYHPERGMVPPSDFIRVAEESGLINPLGKFVLGEACRQARAWHAAGYPQLQVAVNCSAQQFHREGMVESVTGLLEEVGLPPECLELEITESVILQHADQVIEWFRQLSDMGLQLSLDDFGTGYSSLGYLRRFPIRKLKIDQSFVGDIGRDGTEPTIIGAIIAMAHSLGLEVIAEGVETPEQLAYLKSLGCDKAQGYYFSKPVPAEEFVKLLRA